MTESSQPPILKARGITKSFGGFRAVNDMSLDLAASEILGVIGPNGAGKSTLFNLLAGALPVDAAASTWPVKDLTRARPEARILSGLGRTFQIPRPFSRMTVLENVMTAAQNQLGEGLLSALVAPRLVAAQERGERRPGPRHPGFRFAFASGGSTGSGAFGRAAQTARTCPRADGRAKAHPA
jgi:branched-chain amino acid transport system ATP-binding protein